jgi:hypothetical protein
MDSRLQPISGHRLVHLRRSDAPRVAQAIVDAELGRARVVLGLHHDVPYVQFIRDGFYAVVVRGDDWKKIFPFFRYSLSGYNPVTPPPNPPPPIPSPQPNRVRQPPPVSPANGLTSFLENLPFDQYSKIQNLLTTTSIDHLGALGLGASLDPPEEVYEVNPPERRMDATDSSSTALYNRVVALLEQLFPEDFPTSAL